MIAQNKKIAILVGNYFEQAEFTEPLDALKSIGAQVDVVSAVNEPLQGLHHVEKGDTFIADRQLDEVNPNDYDALVLPGGAMNADHLRMNEKAQDWVRDFLENGKLVAAICHAPWLLVSANAVHKRKLTSYYTIQDDIPAFNEAIITFLGKAHAAF